MPTTRGAEKRAQAAAAADAAAAAPSTSTPHKKAKREEQHREPLEHHQEVLYTLSDAVRRHQSQSRTVYEVYEKKDWEMVALALKEFRHRPELGRLEIPFSFHVHKWAARIPPNIAKKDLAPLTNLTRLTFSGTGLNLTQRDPLPVAPGARLPQLRIADLSDTTTEAASVASFMPNVQQLNVRQITLYASRPAVSIERLSHLSCKHIHVYQPRSSEDATAVVAATFPAIRVLTQVPDVVGFPDEEKEPILPLRGPIVIYPEMMSSRRFHVFDYMRQLRNLTAVRRTLYGLWDNYEARCIGGQLAAAMPGRGLRTLAGLTGLRRVMLEYLGELDLPFAAQVSTLQHLTHFTFNLSRHVITPAVHQLLQATLSLPKLESLGLPLHLMCTAGCAPPGMAQTLDQIAAKSSLKQIILLSGNIVAPHLAYSEWPSLSPQTIAYGNLLLSMASTADCSHVQSYAVEIQRLQAIKQLQLQLQMRQAQQLQQLLLMQQQQHHPQQQQEQHQPGAEQQQMVQQRQDNVAQAGLQVVLVNVDHWQQMADPLWGGSAYDWGHPVRGVFGPKDAWYTGLDW